MTVNVTAVAEYVGATSGQYDALLSRLLLEAAGLLRPMLSGVATVEGTDDTYTWAPVDPDTGPAADVLDGAHIEVTADLFTRRNAPHGVLNMQAGYDGTGEPIRINRDPLAPARALLAQWLVPF